MPKCVIESDIPGTGNTTADEVRTVSQKSCSVLNNLRSANQWLDSYVPAGKIYCIYIAASEEMVRHIRGREASQRTLSRKPSL